MSETERRLKESLRTKDFRISESLGQHFLIDEEGIEALQASVQPGSTVIEIGVGPGNLTARLAEKAKQIIAIEIDRNFEPLLQEVSQSNSNVEVIYADALNVDLNDFIDNGQRGQLISNLPYHIIEPLLQKTAAANRIENAVITIGGQSARSMLAKDENDPDFTKTTFVTRSFFHPELILTLPRDSFYPPPRTDSAIVRLQRIDQDEARNSLKLRIAQRLVESANTQSPVGRIINTTPTTEANADLTKKEQRRYRRREVNRELRQLTKRISPDDMSAVEDFQQSRISGNESDNLDLPSSIMGKPFSTLNNQEIRELSVALSKRYGL